MTRSPFLEILLIIAIGLALASLATNLGWVA
jgi:hypothetical protein